MSQQHVSIVWALCENLGKCRLNYGVGDERTVSAAERLRLVLRLLKAIEKAENKAPSSKDVTKEEQSVSVRDTIQSARAIHQGPASYALQCKDKENMTNKSSLLGDALRGEQHGTVTSGAISSCPPEGAKERSRSRAHPRYLRPQRRDSDEEMAEAASGAASHAIAHAQQPVKIRKVRLIVREPNT
ncbi:hypothetical protein FRB90_003269 [Tulasnella sp. 427]|nr:hypothetical protein FRB90_003269 [Tulasnella sp. 427]